MAGAIIAPMNGSNMVGVAWKSNLISVHHDDLVWDIWGSGANTANAIEIAATGGPDPANHRRIIVMAFKANVNSSAIEDKIRQWYNQNRLFVGASGSTGDGSGIAFPAQMAEVIAVSVVNDDYSERTGINYGVNVELTYVYGNLTHAENTFDYQLLGGTSGSVAIASGIAALVWSRYPGETNVQIRERLWKASHNYPNRNRVVGYGVPNAMKAVGGMYRVQIDTTYLTYVDCKYIDYRLTAKKWGGEGPFTYLWSTGATSTTIDLSVNSGDSESVNVRISDASDGTFMTAYRQVHGPEWCGSDPG